MRRILLGLVLGCAASACVQLLGGDEVPVFPNEGGSDGGIDAEGDAGEPDGSAGSKSTGSINVFASAFSRGITASIQFETSPGSSSRCSRTERGACVLVECVNLDGGVDPTRTFASAGRIDFAGGAPEVGFSATPDADGSYAIPQISYDGTKSSFAGGETATLTAVGDDVPAFSQTLHYPLLSTLEQPAPASDGSVSVPRTKDFTFTWGRAAPEAELVVQGYSTGEVTISLACTFSSEAASGTISSVVLSKLPPATQLVFFTATKTVTQAGAFKVTSRLAGEVITPSKSAPIRALLE